MGDHERRSGVKNPVRAAAFVFSIALAWTPTGDGTCAERAGPAQDDSLAARIAKLSAEWDTPDSPGLSVAVARNGATVYEQAVGSASLELGVPMTTESVFQLASVSKQFTAMSVLLLEQRGQISIEDEVRKYLPELPEYDAPLRIRHLLSHTSGLRDVYTLHQALAAPAEDSGSWNDILVRRLAAQRGLNFPAGTDFQYNNGGYVLLAAIVSRVSGLSLQGFLDANIFKPLGMTRTRLDDDPQRLVPHRVTGYSHDGDTWRRAREEILRPGSGGNTGILSTSRDVLRWENNFADGKVGGAALLAKMTTPALLGSGVRLPYGLGVWVMDDHGRKTIQHGGNAPGFSAQTVYYPGDRLAIVVLANFGGFDAPGFASKIADACLGAVPASSSPEATAPRASVAPEELEGKAGVYQHAGSGPFMRLFVLDGTLRWSRGIGTRGSLEMVPLTEGRFVIPGAVPLYFEFSSADGGRHLLCRTTSFAQAPATFERLDPFTPSSADLREYAGDYSSAELEVTYAVGPRGNGLSVRVPGRAGYVLEPCGRDLFQTSGGEAFRFERDSKGRIIQLTFMSNGVWALGFRRVAHD
jgi:CubicO group peptidase (beta-lactamase class C family)